jgi:hypothetical protein
LAAGLMGYESLLRKKWVNRNECSVFMIFQIWKYLRSGIQKEVEGEISSKLKEPGPEYTEEEKNEFVFNTIDDKDEKISGRLLISDGSVLIKQLEQVVKKAVKCNPNILITSFFEPLHHMNPGMS